MKTSFRQVALIGKYHAAVSPAQAGSTRAALEDIVRRTEARGGGLRTLLHEVVQSPLFLGRANERHRDSQPPAVAAHSAPPRDASRMMMASHLPEVQPTTNYIHTVLPASEPLPVKPATIDGSSTITLRVTGLFDAAREDEFEQALLKIPEGKMTTYGTIATRLGDAKASRAVGTAVGRNPVSWLIPCHRVLGSDGALHGYHWGLVRKRSMLAMEAARSEERQIPRTSAIA